MEHIHRMQCNLQCTRELSLSEKDLVKCEIERLSFWISSESSSKTFDSVRKRLRVLFVIPSLHFYMNVSLL